MSPFNWIKRFIGTESRRILEISLEHLNLKQVKEKRRIESKRVFFCMLQESNTILFLNLHMIHQVVIIPTSTSYLCSCDIRESSTQDTHSWIKTEFGSLISHHKEIDLHKQDTTSHFKKNMLDGLHCYITHLTSDRIPIYTI